MVELRGVTKRFGNVAAVDNLSLRVPRGSTVSLLGPSGCGKTTTLRIIAGFEMPDEGAVLIGGADMRGRRPYERAVGLVFQDYALFPHMTVEDNVAYGMRRRGVDRREIPGRIKEMLGLVKLHGMEKRRPTTLSGGQQQRVALARALATTPTVLLLDEPLSALDAKLRLELRTELKEIISSVGATAIVVTHDQEEALSLGERVVVMNEGRVQQEGTPEDISGRPTNKFVAEFIGRSNWVRARLDKQIGDSLWLCHCEHDLHLCVYIEDAVSRSLYDIGIRPERVRLAAHETIDPVGKGQTNSLVGTIRKITHLGPDIELTVQLVGGQLLTAVEKNLGRRFQHVEGSKVHLSFDADECLALPLEQARVL